MEKDKTIELFNKFILINDDRIKVYKTIAKETDEKELKTLFGELAQTSKKCKQELINEVNKLGGSHLEDKTKLGNFFQSWIDIKTGLKQTVRRAILNSCEYGEDMARSAYQKSLNNELEHLNAEHQIMVKAHHTMLNADFDKIKSIRNPLPTY